MTAFYIILSVAAVIALIVFIPVDVAFSVSYTEKKAGVRLVLKYFPVKIKILPSEKKEKKEKKEDKPEKEKKKKTNKQPLSQTLDFAKAVFEETRHDIAELIRHLFRRTLMVKKFYVKAVIGMDNPMITGISYGAANAFIYGLLGLIENHSVLGKWNVELGTDFESGATDAQADIVIRTRIAYIISFGFKAALIILKILKINRRIKKNG